MLGGSLRHMAKPHRQKHPIMIGVVLSLIAGGIIGGVDVLTMESVWPCAFALLGAAFMITWFVPTRWLSVACTLFLMVSLWHLYVRVPWWSHPQEKAPHEWAALLAAVPALGGAALASLTRQLQRKQALTAQQKQR